MAQTQQGTSEKSSRKRAARNLLPADMLKEDHDRVLEMFKQYERMKSDSAKANEKHELALTICEELKVHTKLEEELYYPKVREATHKDDMLNEAQVEHDTADELIRQLESMSPDDRLYDAKMKVLGEYVQHHIKEEQDEMFPLARDAGVDTEELAERMRERKQELQRKLH